MERRIADKNILEKFLEDFVAVLEKHKIKYIVVSGFVAIASGRTRATEDIDMIIEKLSSKKFVQLHNDFLEKGFECLQGENAERIYSDYLSDGISIRYVRKGTFLPPEIEFKFAKDELDELQLTERKKLPLTGLDFWFSSIEYNIAFKEELLKSEKDLEDAKHLRIVYNDVISEDEINKIKQLIRRFRLKNER